MYRVIDTVSIDAMSVTGYYLSRRPREERSVDGSEKREVRLEQSVIRYTEVGTGPALFFVHGV
jgi:hypothetical protein